MKPDSNRFEIDEPRPLAEWFAAVYEELRRMGHQRIARDRAASIQTADLVHDVYVRLRPYSGETTGRVEFFNRAATAMRCALIDRSRKRKVRRQFQVCSSPVPSANELCMLDHLALARALKSLRRQSPNLSQVVDFRYYLGLTIRETALTLGVTSRTVCSRWALAKSWLQRELANKCTAHGDCFEFPQHIPNDRDPKRVGIYQLLRRLGSGELGLVYLARPDNRPTTKIVVKILRNYLVGGDRFADRFERESSTIKKLSHPNIVSVYSFDKTRDGRPYFVMEYVPNGSITSYCDHAELPVQHRLRLFLQACEGLTYAHDSGVFHCDIKPENLLVARRQEGDVVKIIDFGVARSLSDTSRSSGCPPLGTTRYMSPEQLAPANGIADAISDVYSLGIVLQQLLIGVTPQQRPEPFSRAAPSAILASIGKKATTIARQRSTTAAALRTTLQGGLDDVISKALQNDRKYRYQSVSAFASDVSDCLTT